MAQKKTAEAEETLWCLPYDTDSVFKPFLKIPFSAYLNNLISNQNFPAYQFAMSKEIHDQQAWNDKCWRLIQFFEFLNENFEINKWDDYISFIEDNNLRSTMGFFRLWIDTERLYLLNFLKLDSNQFQEDRIYMALYRTLIFFNHLFSEYMYKDFELNFLNSFIRQATAQLQKMSPISTNETSEVIEDIIELLKNIKKKEKVLVEPNVLLSLKKGAGIKVSKEGEAIKEVENRLKNSSTFKRKIDEELRLKMICKAPFVDELSNNIKTSYDPVHKIAVEYDKQFFGTQEQKAKRKQQGINQQITNYKKTVKNPSPIDITIYDTIESNKHNPYALDNFQIYGESVKINMEDRKAYEKVKETEVVSVEDYDRSKFYYDDRFIREAEAADLHLGKVTYKDINLSNKTKSKKPQDFKGQDENTRVFNLKWHQDQQANRNRSNKDTTPFSKDYDNNLLFKSPLEEQMLDNRRNNLDKLRQNLGVKSYTIALLEQTGSEIHPDYLHSSFGSNLFVKKTPQLLDLRNFKLLNQNKFDFMRKVVGYMTAQKKIKNIISEKNVPESYPRYFADVKQDSYDPDLQYQKYKFAMGRTENRPQLYL